MTVSLVGAVRHPKIYAYTFGEYESNEWVGKRKGSGIVKVGYTDRPVDQRIREQLNAVKMPVAVEPSWVLSESAITDDGVAFRDTDVHRALVQMGVQRRDGEWFECTREEVLAAIQAVRAGKAPQTLHPRQDFPLRPEQDRAVEQTAAYFTSREGSERTPHFLWNAKMRFGKTFTTYQLAKRMGWTRVLVLTYKPAVERSWRDDLNHVDFEGWRFKGKNDTPPDPDDATPLVWFASFQDVLGTDERGNPKYKNEYIHLIEWDVVVIDEYHFGAWRDAARSIYVGDREEGIEGDRSEKRALDMPDLEEGFTDDLEEFMPLAVQHYLYLSGTPFRALTEGEFLEDQVFNWTYSDEQRAKAEWSGSHESPYAELPQMHLLTYEMPEKLREVALNSNSEFSLTEFFLTERDGDGVPKLVYEQEVQKWLDLLRGQGITGLWASVSNLNRPPLPYEDINLLRALQHTAWYLPSVDACIAMRDLLVAPHNSFFRDYAVIVAAGSKAGMGEKALPPVEAEIGHIPQDTRSITLTCGKLMTGVTVPAWTGIFMLRELKSPESYFQAAFRVQSPWVSTFADLVEGGESRLIHKEHCYVLDFAPNRALRQIVDYATRLRADTASERDEERALEEFMEFLPVLSFDGYSMSQLRAADVIDYLTRGVSSSMLARRWNSPELLLFDMKSWERLLANPELLASLEQIEMFRNITNDLTAMISTNKELRQKRLSREKLTKEEKERKDDSDKKRQNLRQRLQRFVTRIPAFMYLTDDRERTIRDIIEQLEPELFQKVTGLTLNDFKQLVDTGVFNDTKMNDAVWKFREFEEPSLNYSARTERRTVGGWDRRRDERFASLVDGAILQPGDVLVSVDDPTVTALVTADYGISVGGIRYESPDEASAAVGAEGGGWDLWSIAVDGQSRTLGEVAGEADFPPRSFLPDFLREHWGAKSTEIASWSVPRLLESVSASLGPVLCAYIVGAPTTTALDEWHRDSSKIESATAGRLRAAALVAEGLAELETPRVIQAWLQGLNPELDDQSPLVLLREGDPDDLRAVITAAYRFATQG